MIPLVIFGSTNGSTNEPELHVQVSFCFMHRLPGFRYEVECDEQAIGAHAKNLDISYRSKGKLRFYTPRIKDCKLCCDSKNLLKVADGKHLLIR